MGIKRLLQYAQRLLKKRSSTAASEMFEEGVAASTQEDGAVPCAAHIQIPKGRTAGSSDWGSCPSREKPLSTDAFYPERESADAEDWEVIQAIDADQRVRRCIYDLEAESDEVQDPKVSVESRSSEILSQILASEMSEGVDAISLRSGADSRVKPAEDVAAMPNERPIAVDKEPVFSNKELMAYPDAVAAPLEECFDLDLPGDGIEDEAQRKFEDALVLETDLELGIQVDDDVDATFHDADCIFTSENTEELSDLEWESLALDADDYEEAPKRSNLREITAEGSITRRQRAQQHAIDLGIEFGWDEDGIAVLTEVFDRHWWSQAKVSMRRELLAGMTPDELAIAMELRALWKDHPEFSMDLGRSGGHAWGETTKAVYRNLSWPMSIALVRLTRGLPEVECLEYFLSEVFDQWYTSRSLQRMCKSFNLYLFFRIGMARPQLRDWPDWTFEPDDALGLELDDEHQPGVSTPDYRALDRLGLVSDIRFTPRELKRRPRSAPLPEKQRSGSNLDRSKTGSDAGRTSGQTRVSVVGNRIRLTSQESQKSSASITRSASNVVSVGLIPMRTKTPGGSERKRQLVEDLDW